MAYVAARGDMHRYVNQLHARYGDAVRVGKSHYYCVITDDLGICFQAPTNYHSDMEIWWILSWLTKNYTKAPVSSEFVLPSRLLFIPVQIMIYGSEMAWPHWMLSKTMESTQHDGVYGIEALVPL